MGRLRKSIIIQKNTPTRSATGGDVDVWTTFAARLARIQDMSGREYVGSEQLTDETTHKFTIWFFAGVVPKMRIKYGVRLFDIQSVASDDRDREMFIMAVERG